MQESEGLRNKIQVLRSDRRKLARAIEAEGAKNQAIMDLKRIGAERIAAAAQVLKAGGIPPGSAGTPGAT